MSWVQQSAPSGTIQHQSSVAYVQQAPLPITTLTSTANKKSLCIGKGDFNAAVVSANTNNLNNKSSSNPGGMRSQMHANGGTAASYAPPTQQQQQSSLVYGAGQQHPTQQATWQQPNYLQPNKMMQSAATVNNWPQQQPQQQNLNTSNIYQPNSAPANNWQPADLQAPALQQPATQQQQYAQQQKTQQAQLQQHVQQQQQQQQQQVSQQQSAYDNYFTTTQGTQQPNFLQQQPQQPQHDTASFFQAPQQYQQPHPQSQSIQQPQQPNNFFDNTNSTQNTIKSDGWGDWDWNDNSNTLSNEKEQQKHQHETSQLPQSDNHQSNSSFCNSSVIEESFIPQSQNDNWSWGVGEDSNANTSNVSEQLSINAPNTYDTTPQAPVGTPARQPQSQLQTSLPQPANNIQIPQQQNAAEFAASKPANIAGKTAAQQSTVESANDNYNVHDTASTSVSANNIQNSVYVSQAKPVAHPPRQYASLPGISSPTDTTESTLTPPQAFQNESSTAHSVSIASTPSTGNAALSLPVMTMPTGLPPPSGNVAASGNPFKRAGVAQHHRAGLLTATVSGSSTQMPPSTLTSAPSVTTFAVPPPPADFANPLQNHMEPDNSEYENQEVLGLSAPSVAQTITLPGTSVISPVSSTIAQTLLPQTTPPPPPNDERNQYLQTSHLSEHPDGDSNLESDSLPPPGLSRLVLGQPELGATQRMVTGIEEPANMHFEERLADGEDTSLEQTQPVSTMNVNQRGALHGSGNSGAPSSSASSINNTIDITSDRNLYLVPGESNMGNDQRVVTGVEMGSDIVNNAASVALVSEQREIELDGENLEDQQTTTMATSRNEPPLEGAAAATGTLPIVPSNELPEVHTHHNHHQHQSKSKDLSNVSTGNDESDPVLEHHPHYASRNMNKSRKHSSEVERKMERQRRDKKQRHGSVDHYESGELDHDSEGYSSERERERERERRRGYRESSVRSEHDDREERDYGKEKRRREKRESGGGEREKTRDKYYSRGGEGANTSKMERERRNQRHNRYDEDAEESLPRHKENMRNKEQSRRSGRNGPPLDDRSGRSDRSDRDYDEYNRRHRGSKRDKGDDVRRGAYVDDERREQSRRQRRERNEYDTIERRRRDNKHRERGDVREYEEYRKQSSRNARESDLEKERARGDPRYNPRMTGMYGYPPGTYGYDPYTYYYEQMARTNPQAYAEWYKKYYAQAGVPTATSGTHSSTHSAAGADHLSLNNSSLAATTGDGRESVHSGRSSVQNEKERYTHAYISQANEYHRHLQLQQQHQQRQSSTAYGSMQMSLNSTLLEDSNCSNFYSNDYVLRAARSTSNLSQLGIAAASYYGAVAGGADVMERASYARSEYAESRSGHVSLRDGDNITEPDPQRLTPCKFVNEHTIVSLSAGIMVSVKPKYNSQGILSNIVKLQRLGANDSTRQLFQAFPGPLVRGLTHKKTIIEFCEEQIRLGPMESPIYARQLCSINVEKNRASYTLMWNLLILLLRQNGMVVGTDIAELLLKNQQRFPYESHVANDNNTKAHSNSEDDMSDYSGEAKDNNPSLQDNDVETEQNSGVDGADGAIKSIVPSSTTLFNPAALTEEEVTEKFRSYLLYGNVNEALDWATDNNLWGHALFLASKVDRRSHANVMMKFANKLSLNDPLQTLYQLMSGRQPSSVTSVQDEKWGDWRPHLSMILSNTSQKPELDRKAITTLGDSLFNRGDLFAAHFCYLMAQVGFGRYSESAVQENTLQQNLPKLVLLGSSHYQTFNKFASNEAIMMTEIYEYACSLNDEKFSLVEFQPYKYLLATRMLDYGYNLRSLVYLEQIALHIQRDTSKYESSFICKIYEFADRLKYYDPVLERSVDDQQQNVDGSSAQIFEEQKWLQDLRLIAAQYKLDFVRPSAVGYGHNDEMQSTQDVQNQIDQQFAEINKRFNELNLQYSDNNTGNQGPTFYNTDNPLTQHQPQQKSNNTELYNLQRGFATDNENDSALHSEHQPPLIGDINAQKSADLLEPYDAYHMQQSYMQSDPQQSHHQQHEQQQQNYYYDPTQQHQQQMYNATANTGDAQSGAYDYWTQQQQETTASYGSENVRPTISMPKSKSYDSDDDKQQRKQQQEHQQQSNSNKNIGKQDAGKEANKNSQQNSGWFGGIWNKLSLKPKNQMILPDDKNPTIVWDPDKKKWVNTDGDEKTEENLKPPPKLSDMMPQTTSPVPSMQPQLPPQPQQQQTSSQQYQQQQQQPQSSPLLDTQQYGAGMPNVTSAPIHGYSATALAADAPAPGGVTKTPSLQSNMFKMQRNRTLKNSYVDVFNPSGAPMSKAAENVLAPSLPPAAVPQGGFFIPGMAPATGNDNSDASSAAYQQQQSQQQHMPQQDMPQFYNPNQFGAGNSGAAY